jgi:ATP-dependent RNA helicase HelY
MSQSLSPAEAFAAAKRRTDAPMLQAFRERLQFDLDPFQLSACAVLEQGKSVLVAAPTGAGKTVVAEFAIFMAMARTRDKVFYTTPMKALSNQKFQELVAEYGPESVGLLTGDTNVNSGARIVVMTTEVLRNMLYADSDLLTNLSWVVMDEVHFLADRFRGAVWEEVIIHLPREVRMISLSATVSNAEEFGDWLQAVRGDTEVIVSEERPVPLDQHILMRTRLVDLFDSSGLTAANRVNPELEQLARQGGRSSGSRQHRDVGRYHSRGGRPDSGRMERSDVVRLLEGKNLLPAIFFVFSRIGCDSAVTSVLRAGVRLTTIQERDEIRAIVEERCRTLRDEDLAVLGYWDWLSGLERGVAAHHAGLLPAFKEVVEDLFQRKLLKVVFATETLALGINMPARTVVLERLEKFNGEARVPITPGEYTQLTGRAGRRGIDVEGHSVIQWIDGMDPQAVASLASRRTYPLNSSFTPTYNMAVNLIEQFGRERTREILESSFAQFQADRAVVDLARRVRSQEESLAGYAKSMTCHLGDFAEYSRIRRELTDLERKGAAQGAQASRAERDRRQRQLIDLRKRMRQHPCHACPDRETHARWAERWWRLKRESDQLVAQIKGRTGAVARIFDRVTEVLVELGYLSRSQSGELALEPPGRMLRRIYGERDLLVAESLRRGFWDDLDAPSLAAMATTLVFEPRREEAVSDEFTLPKGPIRAAFSKTSDLWSTLDDLEREHHLTGSEPLATGLARPMFRWVSGAPLDLVLEDAGLAAGDFVRWSKQTIDLLDQLSIVADGKVGRTARKAIDGVLRGVVAYSSVL